MELARHEIEGKFMWKRDERGRKTKQKVPVHLIVYTHVNDSKQYPYHRTRQQESI